MSFVYLVNHTIREMIEIFINLWAVLNTVCIVAILSYAISEPSNKHIHYVALKVAVGPWLEVRFFI